MFGAVYPGRLPLPRDCPGLIYFAPSGLWDWARSART